jgi:SAM-dependent methyltransferase
MHETPLSFLGPLGGKRILLYGVGLEVLAFALAGADVHGVDRSGIRVEALKDLARAMGLRDRTHLQTAETGRLAYPGNFFDLAYGRMVEEGDLASGTQELNRVLKTGGRAALVIQNRSPLVEPVRRAFGSAVLGDCWIGVEKSRTGTARATGRIRTDDRSITNRELYP